MGKKTFIQQYEDFKGLDISSSDLTRPENASKEIVNFEIQKNYSLGGRRGFKMYSENHADGFLGIHTYIYKDAVTNETKEELLAMGQELYRLKEDGVFQITYSGAAANWGYSFLLDEETSTYKFKLYEDATETNSFDIGSGLEMAYHDTTSVNELSDLKTSIDALTDFAVTITDVNTDMNTSVLNLSEETTTTDSTIDVSVAYWETIPSYLNSDEITAGESTFSAYYNRATDASYKPPVFLNKDNKCYIATNGVYPLMRYDSVSVAQTGCPVLVHDDIVLDTTTGTLDGDYYYYIKPVLLDGQGNKVYNAGVITDQISPSTNAVEFDIDYNIWGTSIDIFTATAGATSTVVVDNINEVGLEQKSYEKLRSGDIVKVNNGSGGTFYRELESINRGSETFELAEDVTLTATGNSLYRPHFNHIAYNFDFYSLTDSSTIGTGDSPSSLGFREGMWIFVSKGTNYSGSEYIYDQDASIYRITEIDDSGNLIHIDGKITTTAGQILWISNICLEVSRTQDGGSSVFYKVMDRPAFPSPVNVSDDTADSALGSITTIPTKEQEFLRENPVIIGEHQGLLFASGFTSAPNRVYFEDVVNRESFPIASNYTDVPSQEAGLVTALWSDGFEQLAVFKENAYFALVGDFTPETPLVTIEKITEGDVGISHQTSLQKIRGSNIGIGKLGFVFFKQGKVSYEQTKALDSEFLVSNSGIALDDTDILHPERSFSVNDPLNQRVIFFVPAEVRNSTLTEVSDSSKMYILDYSEGAWLRWSFVSNSSNPNPYNPFLPNAGLAIYNDELFMAKRHYFNWGGYNTYSSMLWKRKTLAVSDPKHDYADQHQPINYDIQNQWVFGESPAIDKLFQMVKAYQLEPNRFAPFTLRVRTYKNWNMSTTVDDFNLAFSTNTTYEMIKKLVKTKARAMLFRFTVNTLHERPTITGYEYSVSQPYDKERLK